jgi:hypothetical protein
MALTIPFALSLSTRCLSYYRHEEERQGFDKLSLSGSGVR